MTIFLSFLSWFNLPSLSDTYTSPGVGTTTGVINLATEYSAPFFLSLSEIIIGLAIGIPIAVLALKWLIKLLRGNVKKPFTTRYNLIRSDQGIRTHGYNSGYNRRMRVNRRYWG